MLIYLSLLIAFLWWTQSTTATHFLQLLNSFDGSRGLIAGPVAMILLFIVSWHGYGATQAFWDRHRIFSQYKIHRKDTLTYVKMMPQILTNQIQLVVLAFLMWYLKLGFSNTLPFPSIGSFLSQFSVLYITYEIIFYATHRLLHSSSFWFTFHAMHHQTKGSIGVSGQYQGGFDFFLTTSLALAVGPMLCNAHVSVVWLATFIGGLNSIQSHGGYYFPWGLMPNPLDHNLHHWNPKVNFGTGPLDFVFGTFSSSSIPESHQSSSPPIENRVLKTEARRRTHVPSTSVNGKLQIRRRQRFS